MSYKSWRIPFPSIGTLIAIKVSISMMLFSLLALFLVIRVIEAVDTGTAWKTEKYWVAINQNRKLAFWGDFSDINGFDSRGNLIPWPEVSNVKEVYTTKQFIVAVDMYGSLTAWGNGRSKGSGGSQKWIVFRASGVKQVAVNSQPASYYSGFIALKNDGSVVWPPGWYLSSSGFPEPFRKCQPYPSRSCTPRKLTGIISIYSNNAEFAALGLDGTLYNSNGNVVASPGGVKTVMSGYNQHDYCDGFPYINANGYACPTGYVYTNTNINRKDSAAYRSAVKSANNVERIFSHDCTQNGRKAGVVLLLSDGTLISQECRSSYGYIHDFPPEGKKNVKSIITSGGFWIAALRHDHTMYTKRVSLDSGSYGSVRNQETLTNVKKIVSHEKGMAALLFDGSVKCWGQYYSGSVSHFGTEGPNPAITSGCGDIIASKNSFACIMMPGGTVRIWGAQSDWTAVTSGVSDIVELYTVGNGYGVNEYMALKSDGSIIALHKPSYSPPVPMPSDVGKPRTLFGSNYWRWTDKYPSVYTLQDGSEPYPTSQPSPSPTSKPSDKPTSQPSGWPTSQPSGWPTSQPSCQPTGSPSSSPTLNYKDTISYEHFLRLDTHDLLQGVGFHYIDDHRFTSIGHFNK